MSTLFRVPTPARIEIRPESFAPATVLNNLQWHKADAASGIG